MQIRHSADSVFARAEHLRVRLELEVDFEVDDDVVGGGDGRSGGHGFVSNVNLNYRPVLIEGIFALSRGFNTIGWPGLLVVRAAKPQEANG
jgi:hypothetical protein